MHTTTTITISLIPYHSPSLTLLPLPPPMGCSASRPAVKTHHFLDQHSDSSSSPKVTRAFSLPTPLVHHPPLKKGDTHHLVSLTSTTYGSLRLLHPHSPQTHDAHSPSALDSTAQPADSLSPHSVINAWELMDGLDDGESDFHLGKPQSQLITDNSEVNFKEKPHSDFYDQSTQTKPLSKPLWKYLSEESLLSKMDPDVVSSYRRALSYRQSESNYYDNLPKSVSSSPSFPSSTGAGKLLEDYRILIYFTSLRGIRKTYEDCCTVRMIFRGMRVAVDERDISMDSNYRKELQRLLGGKVMSLPRVFIRGRYVGGVEEIKLLNESGELAKLLDGFPVGDPRRICERCGDARFMPCPHCNGSRKIFEEATRQLRRCIDCNENGLVRCPGCGSS